MHYIYSVVFCCFKEIINWLQCNLLLLVHPYKGIGRLGKYNYCMLSHEIFQSREMVYFCSTLFIASIMMLSGYGGRNSKLHL